MRTIAVRQAAVNVFDRLYFLLRLTVSGFIVGLFAYLVGLALRIRAGLLPAPRRRFRDRVLNAFFGVGVATVALMGALGLRVVTGENERAIESWLRQHLERVEDTLVQEARGDELPYRVLERTDIDSLAARVGLDLNVYRGFELASTSRPQLARDRLISLRLPIEAFRSLFVDGYRFVDVDETLGSFRYTAGYRSFPDEQGVPRYVVSVPTLPEQERIEEERARTIAYLFGALLLLVLVVMGTAAVIANTLAQPVARIRRGLERVVEGRFNRIQPLQTRDEMSELVETFNTMQDQLAESRRLLAQQERQLAWREMARQVAHEIKNPLTPMKLQVQQLRRALMEPKEGHPLEEQVRSKTATLLDQIEALKRIANEFSNFARMPLQKLEPVDVNEVVREAVDLMGISASIRHEMDLHPGPLSVEADREALRRVFINFVKNAAEAVPEGRTGLIRVVTRLEDDEDTGLPWVVAEISDNGSGIAPEFREKIFTPSFSTKTSGAGLGLAIARNTIEEIRGRIGFDSEDGSGSTFWVRIPLHEGLTASEPAV
jgi:signal transduction histidine kinase